MQIPVYFTLWSYNIYSITIFIALGLVTSALVIWYEGKRDGFDEENIFDLFLSSVIAGLLVFIIFTKVAMYQYFWTLSSSLVSSFIVGLLPVFIFSRLWKWSVYRVLDIFVISFCIGSCVPIFGFVLIYKNLYALFGLAGFVVVSFIFTKLRVTRYFSGLIFSIFLFLLSIVGIIFFNNVENLIIYGILISLGSVNIYVRRKSLMAQDNLPSNLINSLRQRLLSRRKSLKAEQKLLDVEDAAIISNRSDDNSESIDAAILGDSQEEITDARKTSVLRALVDVRRALAKMRIGSYGICEICGNKIDRARLMAYPEATTCLDDANKKQA
ncbi:MAG TPA: TraR/DksA C4-type zinc finger protein [Candidatus Saccharimonadales bacterium]|nr:TraR/DksA C4-type zinc finger protein [Candidatus Saccharimonadales bacterium]